MITDKLVSYSAAKREILPGIEHRQHKGLNSRAENSYQPTRRRERQMKQFKSSGQVQRFLSAHDQIDNLFHLRLNHVTAAKHRASRTQSFHVWAEICNGLRSSRFRPLVASTLYQKVEHNAALVHGSPQPVFHIGDLEHDLIQMPFVADPREPTTDPVRKLQPNLRAHCRTASWLTTMPQAASSSSTIRRPRGKRK